MYKTAWEISQRSVMDMSIGRGPYICQSQSLNIHKESPTADTLTRIMFYGWKHGLKTGMYYLRTRTPDAEDVVSVSQSVLTQVRNATTTDTIPEEDGEGCIMCSG